MSLRYEEFLAISSELTRAFQGAAVHRVTAPTMTSVYLELRHAGRAPLVHMCGETGRARLSVVDASPPGPWSPWESTLNAELSGARLTGVTVAKTHGVVTLDFGRALRSVRLLLEYGEEPLLVLVGDGGGVRATSAPARVDLAVGRPWVPPPERPHLPRPMRLVGDDDECPLARAAERLFEKA